MNNGLILIFQSSVWYTIFLNLLLKKVLGMPQTSNKTNMYFEIIFYNYKICDYCLTILYVDIAED